MDQKRYRVRKWCACLCVCCWLACVLIGCTATSYITSEPPGAKISVDGTYKGQTPLTVKIADKIGCTYNIKAEMQGYASDIKIFREPMLNTGAPTAIPETVHFTLRLTESPQFYPKVAASAVPEKQPPATFYKPKGAKRKRWAVIVGISRYRDTRIPALRYASSDAESLYKWLISPQGGKLAPGRVKLLLDNEATAANIKDALFNWLGKTLEEDIVMIYFAGHGSPQSPDHPDNLFFLPYDSRYDNISSTGFPMWDIKTALKRYIKAKRAIVIADACHSGGVGKSFESAPRLYRGIKVRPINTGNHSLSDVGEGVCVISASYENQYSQESKDWGGGHGVFTYFLLKGLEGNADYNNDAAVTLGELTSYLSQEVRRATKNSQSPTVSGRYDPAMTIAK